MAVTASTITDLTDLAKDYFTNYWQPMMAKGGQLKAQLEQLENWEFAGKKIIFGAKLETGGGVANAGASKSLPDNADGSYDQMETTLKRTYARLAIDAFEIARLAKTKGTFRPAVEEKMDDRGQAMMKDCNRQSWSDGSGKVAMLAAGANSATQTLSRAYFLSDGGSPLKHIYKGDNLAFYTSGGTLVGRRKVVSKTGTLGAATGTVTLASSIDLTSITNGWVAKATADDDNTQAGEVNGVLSAMVQSGTFQGVPIGSTYAAVSISNSGTLRDLDDSVVGTLTNAIHAQCEEFPNLFATRPGITQKYSEIFLPIRRIDGQDVQLKGGYKPVAAIQHAGGTSPVIGDTDCPGARMFALNTKYVKNLDLIGEEWADFDGAQFTRISDQDGAEGYMRKYWQIAWQRLNCHGVVSDLNDVSTVDRIYS